MGTRNSGPKHEHAGKATATHDARKTPRPTGIFINSISTSSEPFIRETVRVKLVADKAK
jgi:hypothetical protein